MRINPSSLSKEGSKVFQSILDAGRPLNYDKLCSARCFRDQAAYDEFEKDLQDHWVLCELLKGVSWESRWPDDPQFPEWGEISEKDLAILKNLASVLVKMEERLERVERDILRHETY